MSNYEIDYELDDFLKKTGKKYEEFKKEFQKILDDDYDFQYIVSDFEIEDIEEETEGYIGDYGSMPTYEEETGRVFQYGEQNVHFGIPDENLKDVMSIEVKVPFASEYDPDYDIIEPDEQFFIDQQRKIIEELSQMGIVKETRRKVMENQENENDNKVTILGEDFYVVLEKKNDKKWEVIDGLYKRWDWYWGEGLLFQRIFFSKDQEYAVEQLEENSIPQTQIKQFFLKDPEGVQYQVQGDSLFFNGRLYDLINEYEESSNTIVDVSKMKLRGQIIEEVKGDVIKTFSGLSDQELEGEKGYDILLNQLYELYNEIQEDIDEIVFDIIYDNGWYKPKNESVTESMIYRKRRIKESKIGRNRRRRIIRESEGDDNEVFLSGENYDITLVKRGQEWDVEEGYLHGGGWSWYYDDGSDGLLFQRLLMSQIQDKFIKDLKENGIPQIQVKQFLLRDPNGTQYQVQGDNNFWYDTIWDIISDMETNYGQEVDVPNLEELIDRTLERLEEEVKDEVREWDDEELKGEDGYDYLKDVFKILVNHISSQAYYEVQEVIEENNWFGEPLDEEEEEEIEESRNIKNKIKRKVREGQDVKYREIEITDKEVKKRNQLSEKVLSDGKIKVFPLSDLKIQNDKIKTKKQRDLISHRQMKRKRGQENEILTQDEEDREKQNKGIKDVQEKLEKSELKTDMAFTESKTLINLSKILDININEQQLSDIKIEKGGLHKQLGYSKNTNLAEVQTDEMIKRQKQYQNKKKGNYKDIIGKLVWQRNITKDNKWKSKLTRVIDELKKWWEEKKD